LVLLADVGMWRMEVLQGQWRRYMESLLEDAATPTSSVFLGGW